MKYDFLFEWNCHSGVTTLSLHDRTKEEAFRIAQEMGYVPITWWKPWTWHNFWYCFARDKE